MQQVALGHHLAQLGLQPRPFQRFAARGTGRQRRLARGEERVAPAAR
jgi:hypothetical protein